MGVLGGSAGRECCEGWEGGDEGSAEVQVYSFSLCSSFLLPAMVVVVKLKDAPILCRTDEVGELCVHSPASAGSYYRLQGRTAHTFQVSR